ncbi:MAG: hypothetical protein OXD43_07880 [Bacteroidetes bacterium]|nr:hypothetical protein [Bacteroidota bacterium]
MIRHGILGLLIASALPLQAQDLVFSPGILANEITNISAAGESVWVGPYMNVSHDGGETWLAANVDSLRGFANSIYSIEVKGQEIWGGLGDSYVRSGSEGQTQTIHEIRGLLHSSDGGNTWDYFSYLPPIDTDPVTTGILDTPDDTLITYGSVTLSTLPITVSARTPPWDISFDPVNETLWIAGELAGIRRSPDFGRTWERVVLPPDTTKYLAPELGYDFPFAAQPVGIAPEQFRGFNFMAFAVLVDNTGTVWAGTAGGLNRSVDGGIRWHHYTIDDGLLGNWIISIEEQPRGTQPPAIWATNWLGIGGNQRLGVSVTRDGGLSFETALQGERCYDFGFDGPRVYVACDRGLYRSTDDGYTFLLENDFVDRRDPSRSIRPGAAVYAVEVVGNTVWVGSEDGLFKSLDHGNSWQIYRTAVPLDPSDLPPIVPRERVPRVSAYAYPNPFSPSSDRLTRLRFDLSNPEAVTIRIFDFGMNLVREIFFSEGSAGANEVAWDGTDKGGVRLANGTYFYAILSQEDTFWGKILIID